MLPFGTNLYTPELFIVSSILNEISSYSEYITSNHSTKVCKIWISELFKAHEYFVPHSYLYFPQLPLITTL
jgi:hypothetical protein